MLYADTTASVEEFSSRCSSSNPQLLSLLQKVCCRHLPCTPPGAQLNTTSSASAAQLPHLQLHPPTTPPQSLSPTQNPLAGISTLEHWTRRACRNVCVSLTTNWPPSTNTRISIRIANSSCSSRRHRKHKRNRTITSPVIRSFWPPHTVATKATTTTLLAAVATTRNPSRCIAVA